MKALAAFLAVAALAGCAQIGDFLRSDSGALVARSVVIVGTSRFIRADEADPLDRAEKTERIATRIRESVEGGPEVSVAEAVAEARDQIGKLGLAPEEILAADLLLEAVAGAVRQAVGDGVLSDQDRATVGTVIGWVVETAQAFQSRQSE